MRLALLLATIALSACTSVEGFTENGGAYPTTPKNDARYWGSYGANGDANTGRLEIRITALPPELALRVAGYPTIEGNELYLEAAGRRFDLKPANPGEKWVEIKFPIPTELHQRGATLVAVDNRTGLQGWFAVEQPAHSWNALGERLRGFLPFVILAIAVLFGAVFVQRRKTQLDLNAVMLVATGVVLAFHFAAVMSYAIDIPIGDEWESVLPDALDHNLNWPWVFRLHNEHRIVTTNLITWWLYRLGGWSITAQIAVNFILYVMMILVLNRFLKEHFDVAFSPIPLLAAAAITPENLAWAFQSQFHLFILFFLLALLWALRRGAWAWGAVISSVACAFSFSTGVICAAFVACFFVYLSRVDKDHRRTRIAQAIAICFGVSLWFVDFHTNPLHPKFALPWDKLFWEHYLNVLSTGFGYQQLTVWPGLAILTLLLVLFIQRGRSLKDDPKRDAWIAAFAIGAATLAGLGAVSLARGQFGAQQSKASRYAEVSFMLVPILYLCARWALLKIGNATLRVALAVVGLVVLVAPYLDDYSFDSVYGGHFYNVRREARKCIRQFYRSGGDANCPAAYPSPIADRLRRAKQLNIAFTRELD